MKKTSPKTAAPTTTFALPNLDQAQRGARVRTGVKAGASVRASASGSCETCLLSM